MDNRGLKTYDNQRFSRTNFNAFHSPRLSTIFEIEWLDNDDFEIHPKSISSADITYDFNCPHLYYPFDVGEWEGKTNTRGIDIDKKTFGICDNLTHTTDPRIQDRWLLLFGIADIKENGEIEDDQSNEVDVSFKGFGLWHAPQSQTTASGFGSVAKGSVGKCTLSTPVAYSFSTGAEVLVWNSTTNFNIGKINSIDSTTTMSIKMDNYSYGTALSGAVTYNIIQTNMFRPYDITQKDTDLYEHYQLITGGLHIINDGGTVLQQFNYDSHHWSCKNYAWLTNQAITTSVVNYPIFNFVPPTAFFSYVLTTVNSGAVNRWVNFRCLPSQSIEFIMDGNTTVPHNSTWLHVHPLVVQLYTNTNTVNITLEITGYDETF